MSGSTGVSVVSSLLCLIKLVEPGAAINSRLVGLQRIFPDVGALLTAATVAKLDSEIYIPSRHQPDVTYKLDAYIEAVHADRWEGKVFDSMDNDGLVPCMLKVSFKPGEEPKRLHLLAEKGLIETLQNEFVRSKGKRVICFLIYRGKLARFIFHGFIASHHDYEPEPQELPDKLRFLPDHINLTERP